MHINAGKTGITSIVLTMAFLGMGCREGGGTGPEIPISQLTLLISRVPPVFTVEENAQFQALVPGASGYVTDNQAATWSTTIGTITQTGLFTAPATPGTGVVRITLKSNPSVTDQRDITVVATPRILSFTATPSTIPHGGTSVLKAEFSEGSGTVDPSVGAVISGQSYPVSPQSTTTYTLKVKNAAGTEITLPVSVSLAPDGSI